MNCTKKSAKVKAYSFDKWKQESNKVSEEEKNLSIRKNYYENKVMDNVTIKQPGAQKKIKILGNSRSI